MSQNEEQDRKEQARERLKKRLDRSEARSKTTDDNLTARTSTAGKRDTNNTNRKRQAKQAEPESLSMSYIFIGLLESYGLKFIAILAACALIVLSFFAGMVLRSCSNEAHVLASSSTSSQAPGSEAGNSLAQTETPGDILLHTLISTATEKISDVKEELSKEDLLNVLEEDLAKKLQTQAKTNADAQWIATHPSSYAVDGWAVQHKILKLAAEEPAAISYVRAWPNDYPAYEQNARNKNAIPTATTGPHNIPLLFQWDPRWGYTIYSGTAFGMTGCCPTAFAMVYQGLTGKTDMSPADMGDLARNDGYMSDYEGTDAYFLINEAQGLGLNCYEIYLSSESIVTALENKQVLIVNVGPGDFTTDGHFIVVTGVKNGKLIVNDPYSKVRSEKLWDVQDIIDQSKAIFAYTKV